MIQIMETLVRMSMTPSEAACFKQVLEYYRDQNGQMWRDVRQAGTCANFVSVCLDALEAKP